MTYKILIDHGACGGGGCKRCRGNGTAKVTPYAPADLTMPDTEDAWEVARDSCECYGGIKINAEVSQCSHPKARQFDSWCSFHDCPAVAHNGQVTRQGGGT